MLIISMSREWHMWSTHLTCSLTVTHYVKCLMLHMGRILGPWRDEVTGEWRRLHNEELNVLPTQYCAGDKIEKNEMGWACGAYG